MMKWTNKDVLYLINNYSSQSVKDISRYLNRSNNSVIQKAFSLGLKRQNIKSGRKRKYKILNECIFGSYSLNNCYWAGFIAADGNVFNNRVDIQINNKDISILYALKDFLECNHRIYYCKQMCRIAITSDIIVQDLKNKFNICENKTYKCSTPLLDGENALAFIVGLFDGDGHCSFYKNSHSNNKHLRWQITGNLLMLEWVRDILNKLVFNSKLGCGYINYNLSNLWGDLIYSHKAANEIYNKLKSIQLDFRLKRKWSYGS